MQVKGKGEMQVKGKGEMQVWQVMGPLEPDQGHLAP